MEQLVRENDSKAGTTTIYSYDKGGNIVSVRVYNYTTGEVSGTPIKTKNYDYKDSEWRDLLTLYNGQAITYDEIGNPLQYRDEYSFTWTNGRSLKSATKGDLHISYKYNRDGIRTEKTVNGKTTKYTLDSNVIVKETSEGKIIWYIYDGNGDLVGFELNGTSYYYNKNLQGDIIGIVDTNGIEVATYRYDAWGSVIAIEGNGEIAKQNPYRYRGYYFDEEIGLYYLQSRYYDAEVGRFINADDVNLIPVMQSGLKGTNLFEYCNNNTVNMEDPTGRWCENINSSIKNLAKGIVKWLIKRVKARLKKIAENIIKHSKRKLKNTFNKAKKQLKRLGKKVIKNVSKAINTVYKSSKKILGNTYKNFEKFFNSLSGWHGFLLGTGLTLVVSNPVSAGIAICCIFILFNYDEAY